MKRLTFMDGFKEPCYRIDGTVYKNEVAQRLAAYEDAGLTPNQVRKISNVLRQFGEEYNCWFDYVAGFMCKYASAEQDGRLVVLPDDDEIRAGNVLEPIKIKSALDSELVKLQFRKANMPKSVSELNYTIIAALIAALEAQKGESYEADPV